MIRRRSPNTLFGDLASVAAAGAISSVATLALQGWQLELPLTADHQPAYDLPSETEISPLEPDSIQPVQ